jgi:effector-binding domain-containing protein
MLNPQLMKILKITGFVILSLIFLLVIVSFFLPSGSHIQRSAMMDADARIPFSFVNNLQEWPKWSPWHKLDTSMVIVYSEKTSGEGASYTWKSKHDQVGEGKQTITKSTPYEHIEAEMEFGDMGTSHISFTFEPVGDSVKVTWAMDSDGKGLPWYMVVPSKYFCLFADKMVGPSFEQGLRNLREISEAAPEMVQIAGFDTEERTLEPVILAGIREKISTRQLSSATFAKWFGEITELLHQGNIQPSGAPRTIYYQYGPDQVEVEAAMPVVSQGRDEGRIKFHETAATKVFVVKYYGDYNKVEHVYSEAYDYLKKHNRSSTGAPMEIYITDPGMEKDTSRWLTEIVFPLD